MTTISKPEIWPDPVWLFREKHSSAPEQPDSSPTDQAATKSEKAVLCKACRTVVTRLNKKITVNGKHMHTFFNPVGIVYEICCFSDASGCKVFGEPTTEFTWFPGYTWEYSVCGTCSDHLGWFYNSTERSFFGLINAKLVMDEPLS